MIVSELARKIEGGFAMRFFRMWMWAALVAGLAAPALAQTTPEKTASAPVPVISSAPATAAQANAQPAYSLPQEKLEKAVRLSRIRNILSITGSIWGLVFVWLLLAVRGWAWLEGLTMRIAKPRWAPGLIFFAAFFLASTLADLPLDLIGHHYSRAYGISVQGWASWFADLAKALGLTLVFGSLLLLLFNWIVRRWPRRYWLGLWLVTLPILVFSDFVAPLVVPLFYKQEPLEKNHAALVAKLEQVVARTGTNIAPERMYLIKASDKSTGINAFVAGIGSTKRFVMWDTSIDKLPDDEVEFIFGHESGHYVLNHIPKGIAGSAIGLFFVYWACAGFAAWMVRRFGARWGADGLASRTGFVVLLFAISITGFLLQPASNAFSRHFEHEADVYGQEAIHGLVADPRKTAVAAFNALGEAWLEDPHPSPLVEFWLYDHPSVQSRANFALHYDPWAGGGHGRFFKNQ
jgi:Zn-dependent protease with chaperone function